MDNLTLLTPENIDNYKLTESFKNDVLVYSEENIINYFSRFEFAINPNTDQLFRRHLIKGNPNEWEKYKPTLNI